MASSSSAYNSEPGADSHRKKRRKIETDPEDVNQSRKTTARSEIKWRSPTQQRLYSTKLVEALSRSRRSSTATGAGEAAPASSGAGEVRGIADRVLAMAAKGRTRWSRAILASRLRMSRLGKRHKKAKAPAGLGRLKKPSSPAGALERGRRKLPAVESRVKVLGRLVPGCRGIPVSNLLEETSDYIAALQMQVRAMTVLTQLLSASQPPSDQLGPSSG